MRARLHLIASKPQLLSILFIATVLITMSVLRARPRDKSRDKPPESFAGKSTARWEWVWDPFATTTEDWQVLQAPQGLVKGPGRTLLASDAAMQRVIWFTFEGEHIQTIGGPGHGPGEFDRPCDLVYSAVDSTLWVADRRLGRLSVFSLGDGAFQFEESASIPELRQEAHPGLARVDSRSFLTAVRRADKRIYKVDTQDGAIHMFGDNWKPDWVPRWRIPDLNEGYIVRGRGTDVFYLWVARGYVEQWTATGTLVAEGSLLTPDVEELLEQPAPKGGTIYEDWLPQLTSGAVFLRDTGTLFVLSPSKPFPSYSLIEVSGNPLVPVNEYLIQDGPNMASLSQLVGYYEAGHEQSVTFFSLDRVNCGVLRIILSVHDH